MYAIIYFNTSFIHKNNYTSILCSPNTGELLISLHDNYLVSTNTFSY